VGGTGGSGTAYPFGTVELIALFSKVRGTRSLNFLCIVFSHRCLSFVLLLAIVLFVLLLAIVLSVLLLTIVLSVLLLAIVLSVLLLAIVLSVLLLAIVLSVLLLLAIVLSVLRFMDSGCPFDIFKLFLLQKICKPEVTRCQV
jgi:hypothetical protein